VWAGKTRPPEAGPEPAAGGKEVLGGAGSGLSGFPFPL